MLNPGETAVLSRGGLLIGTQVGNIQYSAVPETIKDSMLTADGVPAIFVIPPEMFSAERGISLAELEFPAYFNFFLKKKRITIVCRPSQREGLVCILSRSLFGPVEIVRDEFRSSSTLDADGLLREMNFFCKNPYKQGERMVLEDIVEIREFDNSGTIEIGPRTRLVLEQDDDFSVVEDGIKRVRVPAAPPLPPMILSQDDRRIEFHRPILGVSVIGSGHGFDAGNKTSGFIVWIDGHGIMIDPPVDSTEWLRGYDVSNKQVESLILTHCHADHDAGTLQKIVHEGRVTLYTTPTILDNFVGKYAPLTGMTQEAFRGLFDHVPVLTGEPMFINGAEVTFRYSLHAIPCTGFEIYKGGKSLVYPSDTLNDPQSITKLYEQGVLSAERRDELLNFPWEHDLVLHEAGIPPIHTPVETLNELPDDVKAKMFLVHVSSQQLVKTKNLRVAPTGLENTIDLNASREPIDDPLEILDVMGRVEALSQLPLARASEFLRMIRKEEFKAGEQIMSKGEVGDKFYMIISGRASIVIDGEELKSYSDYDYFGETALILDQPRSADVFAKTDITLLSLDRQDFLHLIRGTDLKERMSHLARLRDMPTWPLLCSNRQLGASTSNQLTQMQQIMEPAEFAAGPLEEGSVILIETGKVEASRNGIIISIFSDGDIVGDVAVLSKKNPSPFTFTVVSPVRGYVFAHEEISQFLYKNPGIYMKLRATLPTTTDS